MAPRELSLRQLLSAWKREIIAHGYRLLWPAQTTSRILEAVCRADLTRRLGREQSS